MKTIIAIMLAATVAGAQDYEEYLAYNSTPVQKSAYQAGYEAGLAACSCSGGYSVPIVVYSAPAPSAPPPLVVPQVRDTGPTPERMRHTAEQSQLFYLSGGKVLE